MFKYEVIIYWSAADQTYVAEVPELPGCVAHGSTQEVALANANEAIRLWIDTPGNSATLSQSRKASVSCLPRSKLRNTKPEKCYRHHGELRRPAGGIGCTLRPCRLPYRLATRSRQ